MWLCLNLPFWLFSFYPDWFWSSFSFSAYFLIHFLFCIDLYLFVSFVFTVALGFIEYIWYFMVGPLGLSQELLLKLKTVFCFLFFLGFLFVGLFVFCLQAMSLLQNPGTFFMILSFQICYRIKTLSLLFIFWTPLDNMRPKDWVAKCPVMQSQSFCCFGSPQPFSLQWTCWSSVPKSSNVAFEN